MAESKTGRGQSGAPRTQGKPGTPAKQDMPGKQDKKGKSPTPGAAKGDAGSFEVLRAWVADGDLYTDFISNLWEPQGYGTFLADLARQIADGILEDDPSLKASVVMAEIRKAFAEELDNLSEAEMVRHKK